MSATANALRVLEARYLRRDAERRIVETPDQLFHRVARAVAQGELLVGTAADADRAMAILQRAGGGTGFPFSRLRPRGDVVASTGGEASGPVSFMCVFNCATEHIKQGLGLKGVTVYRTGARPADVLTLGAGEDWTMREFFAKCDPGACRL
jgi:ribonucleoside-diphosphate reductase alpha chain